MSANLDAKHTVVYSSDLGDTDCGLGVAQALDIVYKLECHNIPSCVTGPKALVYYGARRAAQDWEVAVPDDSFDKAKMLFEEDPGYKKLEPVMPQPRSLIHTYPLFKLKGVVFTFFLVPASGPCIDCDADKCERSHNGIPYPKLDHLAQSLLDTQNYADLEDLVDGMDLEEAWGEGYLELDRVPIDYINRKNALICESLPGLPGLMAALSTAPDARVEWTRAVQGKRARMVPKYPAATYSTRFRLIGSADPRFDTRRQV